MTAKYYLQGYKMYKTRCLMMAEEVKEIESNIISLKSPCLSERVQSSPKNDPIGEMVIQLESDKAKLVLRMTGLRAKMMVIRNQVEAMAKINEEYCAVLLLRHILGKDWKFICSSLNISRAQANKIHGKALQEFERQFADRYVN